MRLASFSRRFRPAYAAWRQRHQSTPPINAINHRHQSRSSINTINQHHQSTPPINAINQRRQSTPSINAVNQRHRSTPPINAINQRRQSTSSINAVNQHRLLTPSINTTNHHHQSRIERGRCRAGVCVGAWRHLQQREGLGGPAAASEEGPEVVADTVGLDACTGPAEVIRAGCLEHSPCLIDGLCRGRARDPSRQADAAAPS